MRGVLILAAITAAMSADTAPAPGWTTDATVTRVIDGDTLEVEIRRRIRVRLRDCWAPESRLDSRIPAQDREAERQRGLAAKANLQAIAGGQDVIVHFDAPESGDLSQIFTLGRVVGRVWLASERSESLNERQVREGFATPTKGVW